MLRLTNANAASSNDLMSLAINNQWLSADVSLNGCVEVLALDGSTKHGNATRRQHSQKIKVQKISKDRCSGTNISPVLSLSLLFTSNCDSHFLTSFPLSCSTPNNDTTCSECLISLGCVLKTLVQVDTPPFGAPPT